MLHGKIEVNNVAIGYWEAVRKERVMGDIHKYECVLYYRNHEGCPLHAEFTVLHPEAYGAARLAGTVINMGIPKLKGYPRGTDKVFPV